MDKIKHKIETRIKQINAILPSQLNAWEMETSVLKIEIKRFRRQNVQVRIRNFFIALFGLALVALIFGSEVYYYVGGAAFICAYIILTPSARYTRFLTLARQKLFLLELVNDLEIPMASLAPQTDVLLE